MTRNQKAAAYNTAYNFHLSTVGATRAINELDCFNAYAFGSFFAYNGRTPNWVRDGQAKYAPQKAASVELPVDDDVVVAPVKAVRKAKAA